MRRELLADYAASEVEMQERAARSASTMEEARDAYRAALLRRLPRVQPRITWADQTRKPLWPQVPFAGSLLVRLVPAAPEEFEAHHGFAPELLPDVLRFSRETGRVQFVLSHPPTDYAGLAYLEPVLTERRPPQFSVVLPPERSDALARAEVEFETIASTRYDDWRRTFALAAGPASERFHHAVGRERERRAFATLRAMGAHDVADEILLQMSLDPPTAFRMQLVATQFMAGPYGDPLHAGRSYSADALFFAQETMGLERPSQLTFPHEVGSLLMRKLVLRGDELAGCERVLDTYREADVLKLVDALSSVVDDPEEMVRTSAELSDRLDAVWAGAARVGRAAGALTTGIGVGLGTMGAAVGDLPGLLGAFGVHVLDRMTADASGKAGAAVAKRLFDPRTVLVYEFQQKYRHGLPPS